MNFDGLAADELPARMRAAISFSWATFARKVGGELIAVNKEASMQLQFAYILQQVLPLITFKEDEEVTLELETGVNVNGSNHEIDIRVVGSSPHRKYRIAVELKCYRKKASSGRKRGATDIFMKDVYEDLAILERYVECGEADEGVFLVMNDRKGFVHPGLDKSAKCWAYDISEGATFGPLVERTPVGGKSVHVELRKSYVINWTEYAGFWFSEVQGKSPPAH